MHVYNMCLGNGRSARANVSSHRASRFTRESADISSSVTRAAAAEAAEARAEARARAAAAEAAEARARAAALTIGPEVLGVDPRSASAST